MKTLLYNMTKLSNHILKKYKAMNDMFRNKSGCIRVKPKGFLGLNKDETLLNR